MSDAKKALFLEEFYPKKYFQKTDINQGFEKILLHATEQVPMQK